MSDASERPSADVLTGKGNHAHQPVTGAQRTSGQGRWRLAEDSIWRDRSFQLLFSGSAVSVAGTAITQVVLPILVFQLTGSALQTSTLLIIQVVPTMTLGLVAGAIADRVNRRILIVGADLVNAAALAVIPIMSAAGALTVPVIYLVALVSATAFVFGNAAAFGARPAIVGKDRLLTATSAMGAAHEIGYMMASALGGLLATTIGAAPAIWIDVATFLVSALAFAQIPRAFGTIRVASADDSRRVVARLIRDVGEGLRFVWGHRLIRPLTLMGFGNSFTAGAVLGLMVVYGVRQLGLPNDDARLGLLFSAGWAGAVVGALLLPRLARWLGAARLSLLNLSVNLPLVCAVALSSNFYLSVVMLFAWQTTWLISIGNNRVLRQRLTPDRLQSRVSITAQILSWGGQPFGAALGGLLADAIDVRIALLVTAGGVAASAIYGWCSPLRRVTDTDVQELVNAADRADV